MIASKPNEKNNNMFPVKCEWSIFGTVKKKEALSHVLFAESKPHRSLKHSISKLTLHMRCVYRCIYYISYIHIEKIPIKQEINTFIYFLRSPYYFEIMSSFPGHSKRDDQNEEEEQEEADEKHQVPYKIYIYRFLR